jgi:hypothetical protein
MEMLRLLARGEREIEAGKGFEPKEVRDEAWRDLLKASEEVSELWSGGSALEEIQAQREK